MDFGAIDLPLAKSWSCDNAVKSSRVYRFVTEPGEIREVTDADLHTPKKMRELIASTWDRKTMSQQIGKKTSSTMRADIDSALYRAFYSRNFEVFFQGQTAKECGLTDEEKVFLYASHVAQMTRNETYMVPILAACTFVVIIGAFFAIYPRLHQLFIRAESVYFDPTINVVQKTFEIPQDAHKGSVHSWVHATPGYIQVATVSPIGDDKSEGKLVLTAFDRFDMSKKPNQLVLSSNVKYHRDDTKGIRNMASSECDGFVALVHEDTLDDPGLVFHFIFGPGAHRLKDRHARWKMIPSREEMYMFRKVSSVSVTCKRGYDDISVTAVWVTGDYSSRRRTYGRTVSVSAYDERVRKVSEVFNLADSVPIRYRDNKSRTTPFANTDEPVSIIRIPGQLFLAAENANRMLAHFMVERDGLYTPVVQMFLGKRIPNISSSVTQISDSAYGTPWGWFCEYIGDRYGFRPKVVCFRHIWNYDNDAHGGVYANVLDVQRGVVTSGSMIQLAEDSSGHEHSTFLKKVGSHIAMVYVKERVGTHEESFLLRIFDDTLQHKVGSSTIRKIDSRLGGVTRINAARLSDDEIAVTTFQEGAAYSLHVITILEFNPVRNTILSIIVGAVVLFFVWPSVLQDLVSSSIKGSDKNVLSLYDVVTEDSFRLVDRIGEGEDEAVEVGECVAASREDYFEDAWTVDGFEWVE